MPARFFCRTGELTGTEFLISSEATIGRDPSSNIVLNHKNVSGTHARITFDEKEKCYFLEDLHSRNGTRLDGMKVTEKEKLGNLHVITFARTVDFIFQMVDKSRVPGKGKKVVGKHETILDQEVVIVPPELEEN